MMYHQKLSVVIKVNNCVLRENKEVVSIPFGTEYSIFLKNINTMRAIVNITIDGTDAVPGGLVINANSSVDLERFIKNGNLKTGNKFKFVEMTSQIEQHRGIGAEDGLIRISYRYEKPTPRVFLPNVVPGHWKCTPCNHVDAVGQVYSNAMRGGLTNSYTGVLGVPMSSLAGAAGVSSQGLNTAIGSTQSINSMATSSCSIPVNDMGITVPGSKSTQEFHSVKDFATENEEYVIVLKLVGVTATGKEVTEPITVKTKLKCITCGKKNKATVQFCSTCGTAVLIN
jgi:hypothetical protein